MNEFAKNLRARIADMGLSQSAAARLCDLDPRRFNNYVTGHREPDIGMLVHIAKRLKTTPDALLGFSAPVGREKASKLRQQISASLERLDEGTLELVLIQVRAVAQS